VLSSSVECFSISGTYSTYKLFTATSMVDPVSFFSDTNVKQAPSCVSHEGEVNCEFQS
jgi:hypothetical protein